ncbi:acetolactate synthase, small subunit [Peptoclostridium litorale DSM 5388]|uniref:ACT domain-containing protein n=1 Tax=Peptoclostridium litorale DSM 5388 TaxID=1121324 RepID=A0A069RGY2_PEPLI|nr:ACT domain-containing protein [Peptoclostridium litorale]KDR96043.1 hypothetical protein CLIT_5c00550 [Peptoclostridium litorale DSM 5388]SIO05981.1 acetolactate synthase, small subunit [Peptoclostridium litorale DSM 5388]
MDRMLSVKVESGMESLLRVVGVLRRKEFSIKNLQMDFSDCGTSSLFITINDGERLGVNQAIKHMEKLVDVFEIEELKGEN